MARKRWAAAAALAGGAAWCARRAKKYPLAKGLWPVQLVSVPGGALNAATARAGNALLRRMPAPKTPPDLVRAQRTADTPNGALRLTLYAPKNAAGPLPCLVYLHGGGFCFEEAGYLVRNVMDYARGARCLVVFVHYRTSDRAPFPAAFDDACSALRYVWEHSAALGVDRTRIAVGGDSAGGALAASCAQWARDETDIRLCFQLLVYPVTDMRMATASMRAGADTPCWNARLDRRMWKLYLRKGLCGRPAAYASPLLAENFAGLPPAYIETEAFDCLRDEGLAYAKALRRAGVPVQSAQRAGTFHGFDMCRGARAVHRAMRSRIGALRRAFGQEE